MSFIIRRFGSQSCDWAPAVADVVRLWLRTRLRRRVSTQQRRMTCRHLARFMSARRWFIRRFMKGDLHIGQGSRQSNLLCSRYCNNYKVSEVGRAKAISLFRGHLRGDKALYSSLWTLSGRRLVCHCKPTQSCHGDVLIEEFVRTYPLAHNRNDLASEPPSAAVLDFVAKLREEQDSESDSR